jgi:hypothetical protein
LSNPSNNDVAEDFGQQDELEFEEKQPTLSELVDRIKDPFDPLQIKINRRVVTVGQVVSRIGFGEIDLAPDFQRRARIWDIPRKSRLIESIILRIPLPVFYVAADSHENWRVVDGLQRLTTIYDFIVPSTEHRFSLRGLEYLADFEGADYDHLPRGIMRRIDETELNINVIESGTPDQVMFNIFKRLNTGGLILNGQEIRNALNPGPARDFLAKLSTSGDFQTATDHSVKDDRMGARELVLRFIAFYITPYQNYNAGDLDGFLNDAMKKLNSLTDEECQALRAAFSNAMNRAFAIFGRDAFRKRYDPIAARNRVNRALFEAWSVALAMLDENEAKMSISQADEIRLSFTSVLLRDAEFNTSISVGTGARATVLKRFSAVEKIIRDAIDAF